MGSWIASGWYSERSEHTSEAIELQTCSRIRFSNILLLFIRVEPAAGAAKDAPVCVFIHGGGYVIASNKVYRKMAAALAKRGWRVLTVDYRLASPTDPKYTFPCGLIDILSGYAYVINSGVDPKQVVISGDSAGGGGTLVTGIYLRDHGKAAGLPQAAALIPICPWVSFRAKQALFKTLR